MYAEAEVINVRAVLSFFPVAIIFIIIVLFVLQR